jgi:uncharacterized protein (TIRG00374 family)
MEKTNKKTNNIFRKMIPGLLLGFLALLGLALAGDLRQVYSVMQVFDWRLFPLALLFTLFNYILRFIKWHYYLGLMDIQRPVWTESLRLFVAGFPLAVTPGKAGEVLKGVWLKQKTGLPVAKGISVVLAERISDGLAVLFLSTLGVVVYPQYWPAFFIILAGLLGIIIISQIRPAAIWLLNLAGKIPVVKRIVPGLLEFYEGSYVLFKPKATLTAVGLGTVSWLGEGVGFYFLLTGLGLEANSKLLLLAVFTLSFSTVVGAVSALPGGLGAAEASIAGMLVVLAGISAPIASAGTLLIRLATLWFGVFLGLVTWLISPEFFRYGEDDVRYE